MRYTTKEESYSKPGYKDPRIEHRYPSSTKHEIFQQYFLLATKSNNGVSLLTFWSSTMQGHNRTARGR